jgi:hypothetical protein
MSSSLSLTPQPLSRWERGEVEADKLLFTWESARLKRESLRSQVRA